MASRRRAPTSPERSEGRAGGGGLATFPRTRALAQLLLGKWRRCNMAFERGHRVADANVGVGGSTVLHVREREHLGAALGAATTQATGRLASICQKANRSCRASWRERRPWERKRVSEDYRRRRGSPHGKPLRCCANTTSRPRRCCFELVCRNTDLRERRRKEMALPCACRRSDSAGSLSMRRRRWGTAPSGCTSLRQIDPRDLGLYFYASSAARDLGEGARTLFALLPDRERGVSS